MNRRAFFLGLASIAPAIFIPKLIKPAWKVIRIGCPVSNDFICITNPVWEAAEYELAFTPYAHFVKITERLGWGAVRYKEYPDGTFRLVPQYQLISA